MDPPIEGRTLIPNWYRSHAVPKFGLQSGWITGSCHYTRTQRGSDKSDRKNNLQQAVINRIENGILVNFLETLFVIQIQ